LTLKRQIKYLYLRFRRIKAEPEELALGTALGIFSGMIPIVPFQILLALALAVTFKGSKLMAALFTWYSNPFSWYFIYYYSFKLGALLLGMPGHHEVLTSILTVLRSGEGVMAIIAKIAGAGGSAFASFLLGGIAIGLFLAVPSYFMSLRLFIFLRSWRKARKEYPY
jgi:uncharacterized protein (DUF2062 family)